MENILCALKYYTGRIIIYKVFLSLILVRIMNSYQLDCIFIYSSYFKTNFPKETLSFLFIIFHPNINFLYFHTLSLYYSIANKLF